MNYPIKIKNQPTESTCGQTCLHGIFNYHGEFVSLKSLIDEVPIVDGGGTLGVHLATVAINHGYSVIVYSYNLNVFDPTWFGLSKQLMSEKLRLQANFAKKVKKVKASMAYLEFLRKGGKILFDELTPELLQKLLKNCGPLLCGLSATYLYQSAREFGENCEFDDVRGDPQGHFVILSGITEKLDKVWVCDPSMHNPLGKKTKYQITINRFVNAILLGVITYDANLIIIKPKGRIV